LFAAVGVCNSTYAQTRRLDDLYSFTLHNGLAS